MLWIQRSLHRKKINVTLQTPMPENGDQLVEYDLTPKLKVRHY